MTAALTPLLELARETGAHVLAVHHLGKGEREDGDSCWAPRPSSPRWTPR